MAASMWDPALRATFAERLKKLNSGTKGVVIYVAPFPKSAPTAPELLARCDGASLDDEKTALLANFEKLARVKPGDPLQEHPAFGVLTHRAYGVLMARHTEHHFRQFGL